MVPNCRDVFSRLDHVVTIKLDKKERNARVMLDHVVTIKHYYIDNIDKQ